MVNTDGFENTCSCFNLKGILVDEENSGPVAQWITRLTTDQKIPGSNPGRFGTFSVPRNADLQAAVASMCCVKGRNLSDQVYK